jgi:hypothetical protein
MFKDRTARDLGILTLVKLAVIIAIYYACFAAYDGRPVDTAAHLLGPAAIGSGPTISTSRGS